MPSRRRLAVSVLSVPLALALLVAPGVTPPVLACSCGVSEAPMRDAATQPDSTVFTGVAGPAEPIGVTIRITRWFHGTPPGPVLTLDGRGFIDPNGGSCGTNAPPAGTEWIFVSSRNDRGLYDVNLCSTHAPLASDVGVELLAEAAATFGDAVVYEPEDGGGDAAGGDFPLAAPVVLGLTGAAGVLVLLGAVWVRNRRPVDG